MSFQSYLNKMLPAQASKESLEQQRLFLEQLAAIQQTLKELVDSARDENKQYLKEKTDDILSAIESHSVKQVNDRIDLLNQELKSLLDAKGEKSKEVERVSFLDVKPTNIANIRYLVRLLKQAQAQEATPEAAETTNKITEKVEKDIGIKPSEPIRPSLSWNPTAIKNPLEGMHTPGVLKEYGSVAASPFADYQVLIKGFYDSLRSITPNFLKNFFTKQRTFRLPSFGSHKQEEDVKEHTTEAKAEQPELLQASLTDIVKEIERLLDSMEESDEALIDRVEALTKVVESDVSKSSDLERVCQEVEALRNELSSFVAIPPTLDRNINYLQGETKLLTTGNLPSTELYDRTTKAGFDPITGYYNLPEDAYSVVEVASSSLNSEKPMLALPEHKVGGSQSISESVKEDPVVATIQQEDAEDDAQTEENHKEVVEELKKARTAQFKISDMLSSPALLLGGLGTALASALFSDKGREFFGAIADKILSGVKSIMTDVFDSALGWIAKQLNWDYESRAVKGDDDYLLNQAKAAAAAGQRVPHPRMYALDKSNNVTLGQENMSDASKKLSSSLTYWDKLDAADTFIGTASGVLAGAGAGALLGTKIGSAGGPIGMGAGALIGGLLGGAVGWLYSDTRATDRIIEEYKKQGFSEEEAEANVETLIEVAKNVDTAIKRQINYLRQGNTAMDVTEGQVTVPAQFVKSVLKANGLMDSDGKLTQKFHQLDDESLRRLLTYSVGAPNVRFGVKGNSIRITAAGDMPAVDFTPAKVEKKTKKLKGGGYSEYKLGGVPETQQVEEVVTPANIKGFKDLVKGSYSADKISNSLVAKEADYERKAKQALEALAPVSMGQGSRLNAQGSSIGQGLGSEHLQTYSYEKDEFRHIKSDAILDNENLRYIRGVLRSKGYSESAIAGILANIYAESSFNPKADNGVGYGIAQWAGDRRKRLKKDYPDNYATIEAQTAFLVTELAEMGFTPQNMNNLSPQEAALKIAGGYEASSQGYGRSIASYLKSREKKGGDRDKSGNIIWSDPGWYWANPEVRSKNAVWFHERAYETEPSTASVAVSTQPSATPGPTTLQTLAQANKLKPAQAPAPGTEVAQNVNNSNVVVNNYYTSSNGLNIGDYS